MWTVRETPFSTTVVWASTVHFASPVELARDDELERTLVELEELECADALDRADALEPASAAAARNPADLSVRAPEIAGTGGFGRGITTFDSDATVRPSSAFEPPARG